MSFSFLVEVVAEPDVDAAARDLAGHGLAIRAVAGAPPGRWYLTAGCSSEEAMPAGAADVVVCSRQGILHPADAALLTAHKRWLAAHTNPRGLRGGWTTRCRTPTCSSASPRPVSSSRELVATMRPEPVVFALANPVPEVYPEDLEGTGAVVATGRSDYPNQINNVLAFPGIFRGALDAGAPRITEAMKIAAAAAALAGLAAPGLAREYLLPDPFDPTVVPAVAAAVINAHRAVDRIGSAGPSMKPAAVDANETPRTAGDDGRFRP